MRVFSGICVLYSESVNEYAMIKIKRMKYQSLIWIILCILIFQTKILAQNNKQTHFEATLNAGINNSMGWELEPEFFYTPFRYWGIGAGVAYTGMIGEESHGGRSVDGRLLWILNEEHPWYPFTFRLKMKISTPKFFGGVTRDGRFSFSLYPGLIIPFPLNPVYQVDYIPNVDQFTGPPVKIGTVKGSGARMVYYSVKLQLNYYIDSNFYLSAGYTLSDYDLYGGMRRLEIEGKKLELKPKTLMHLFTLGATFCF